MRLSSWGIAAVSGVAIGEAFNLDVNNVDSIKAAAKSVAKGLIASYNGTKPGLIPGVFDQPYLWWSGGVVWDAMVDYYYLTGDTTYNDITKQALLFQSGSNQDYEPANQTKTEGNDDQSVWALAALTALERSFPGGEPSYLTLARNVFDAQALRWDSKTCGGGLRWQIFVFNNGYNYKNSQSNGQFFELAARLAHYTSNSTYSDWAAKAYDWTEGAGLIDGNGNVFDGTDVTTNCSQINRIQLSAASGAFLYGSALMYNTTNGSELWKNRTSTLLTSVKNVFFASNVVSEVACEQSGNCNVDQRFFKGMLLRNLARTAQVAPFAAGTISPLLQGSAEAAASTGCAKSSDQCSFGWVPGSPQGDTGLGPQFSVLEAIQANLVRVGKGLSTGSGSSAANISGASSGTGPAATAKTGEGMTLRPNRSTFGAMAAVVWIYVVCTWHGL